MYRAIQFITGGGSRRHKNCIARPVEDHRFTAEDMAAGHDVAAEAASAPLRVSRSPRARRENMFYDIQWHQKRSKNAWKMHRRQQQFNNNCVSSKQTPGNVGSMKMLNKNYEFRKRHHILPWKSQDTTVETRWADASLCQVSATWLNLLAQHRSSTPPESHSHYVNEHP